MDKICNNCGLPYSNSDEVEGCCSVRCAFEKGEIEECPSCGNMGMIEVSPDPYVSECVPCPDGCNAEDPWVLLEKNEKPSPPPFDNSEILF